MKKLATALTIAIVSLGMTASASFAKKAKYEGGAPGKGSISGTVTLKGDAPPPIMEDLSKGKNVEFCSTHPEAKDGIRPRVKVVVNGGKLKDAVVFIENIEKGKDWPANPIATFDFKTCDIFPKMAVVRKSGKKEKELVKIVNQDPDILHNPHGYSVAGANRKTLFNKPLPSKGDVADVSKSLKRFKKKKDSHFFLQCDQHNFMEADARIVWNPYYALSGDDGSFKIDGIPAGKYKVTAWQPYVGSVTQEITVGDGDTAANFELTAK
ncbi:MAG: carboxypeptidase regulatory-like domain-containing protein [Nitrospinaceae bacterium]|nr:MAG: carboxypeptidase regulatory-like domain-containing protein [Nitrospinaceae bacterium]